jgi:hypothetical protein
MKRGAVIAVLALVVGLAVWLGWRARQTSTTAILPPEQASSEPALPASPVTVANDGLPIMPAGPRAPIPDGPVHPHPITPEHERIFEENRLIGALNGAMDLKDVAGLRRLLEEYQDKYPEDDQMLQGGYAAIADCLEHPGEASRAAAQRWAEEHRGSTLRRFVYRHCLGQ